jgi:hypothetical protein
MQGTWDGLPTDLVGLIFQIRTHILTHAQHTIARISRGARVRRILTRARTRGRPLRNVPLSLQGLSLNSRQLDSLGKHLQMSSKTHKSQRMRAINVTVTTMSMRALASQQYLSEYSEVLSINS